MRLFGFRNDSLQKGKGVLSAGLWSLFSMSMWTSVAVADMTAADYFVHSLPGAPDGPLLKMHAGFVEVNQEHHGNLFFWHYQNRHIANRQRTVIWFNGGPGCSSEDGGLMEIGPYRLKDEDHLEYNPGSWDEFANIMFVDNPVGTGFSYVDSDSYLHELPEMANQIIIFLEKFFAIFPEYEMDDIYLAGESYAGQHIPYIAKAILDRNAAGPKLHHWNLKGMLIGNGWISPLEQYPAYLTFAYEKGLIERGSNVAAQLEARQSTCMTSLAQGNNKDRVDLPECEAVLQDILQLTQVDGQCINMYDVRLRDSYPSCGMNWPPDLVHVTPYLRKPEVIKALNIADGPRQGWSECNGAVGGAFRARHSKPSIQILPELIEQVPTILFSGAEDLICNHIGTEDFINNMSWNGGTGFELSPGNWAPRRDWTFEGEPAGIYQSARNLTYILFYNSSHMVPFDYARRSRDMLDRFMGVDIASIGGVPSDSRIDGEKAGPETSVGGHPNSTVAEGAEAAKVAAAKWHAYYRSGEVVLVIVSIAATVWGYFVWMDRRRRAGYSGVEGGSGGSRRPMALGHGGLGGLENFRRRGGGGGDVEAGDFDESELDELHVETPTEEEEESRGGAGGRYSVGGVSDDDDDDEEKRAGNRHVGEGSGR